MKHKLNEKIAELRKEAGLTQQQLASALQVSAAAVSKWETGVSVPDIETLCALADYFQVTMDALMGRVSSQPRAVLFLYDRKGESQARQTLARHNIAVSGVAETLSQTAELLGKGDADYLIVLSLSNVPEYVSDKLSGLTEGRKIKRLTVTTGEEEQLGMALDMLLQSFVKS